MKKRKEYFCIFMIMLLNLLGSYVIWNYSMPGHDHSSFGLFGPSTVAAQTPPPVINVSLPGPPAVVAAPVGVISSPAAASTLNTAVPEKQALSIPILMYHKINPYPRGASLYRIQPDEFDWQMKYLYENGYHSISLDALVDHFQKGLVLPDKSVVITLDDGYQDNYLYAYPILKKYGFTATIFIVTNTVASPKENTTMLNWDQIKEMANGGITIGCHTLDHANLTRVDLGEARRQIADAKNVLEEQLNRKINYFAYPYGDHNQNVEKIVQECGFRAAITVNPEPVTSLENPFTLNRMGIYSNLDRQGFIDKISS